MIEKRLGKIDFVEFGSMEVSVRRPSKDDESIRSIRLHDIPWIEPVELKCRYFHQNTGAVR